MSSLIRKKRDHPDETRPVEDRRGKVDIVSLETGAVGRTMFLPGWRWSQHVKPAAGTDSCMIGHAGSTISGRTKVVMDDREEMEFGQVTWG